MDYKLIIKREFKAPRELVFRAFSEAELLAKWWGPKGSTISVVKLDFRKGGVFHYKLEGGGMVMWGIFHYGNINKPNIIEFVSSFSNEAGGIARAPFSETWPLEVYNKLELEEKNGITQLTLSGGPINASKAEEEMFASFTANMEQGFKGTFDQLEDLLAS